MGRQVHRVEIIRDFRLKSPFILENWCFLYVTLGLPARGGRGVNLVQNVGTSCAGGLGDRSPPVGSRSGGRSPPEAEAILDFYMHNFDLILNYFCFARAIAGG